MISALWTYLKEDAFTNTKDVVVSFEFAVAAVLGTLFGYFGTRLGIADASTGDVVLLLLAYAAIGFGFSVSGLTLVLTAPDRDFAARLAWSDPGQKGLALTAPKRNSYSKLLFIFSWTAIAHWAVVAGSFALLLALGRDTPLLQSGSSDLHRAGVGLEAAATVYAVSLFLITVLTLAEVGRTYIERLQETKPTS
jgi:hypothetical protein